MYRYWTASVREAEKNPIKYAHGFVCVILSWLYHQLWMVCPYSAGLLSVLAIAGLTVKWNDAEEYGWNLHEANPNKTLQNANHVLCFWICRMQYWNMMSHYTCSWHIILHRVVYTLCDAMPHNLHWRTIPFIQLQYCMYKAWQDKYVLGLWKLVKGNVEMVIYLRHNPWTDHGGYWCNAESHAIWRKLAYGIKAGDRRLI